MTVKDGYAAGTNLLMPNPVPETYQSMIDGTYEDCISKKLVEKFQQNGIEIRGKTIWDIGAHIGYQSFAFAALVGKDGKVVAFEPNPNNIEWFKKNFAVNEEVAKRITLRNEAVSDTNDILHFSMSKSTDDATTSGGYIDSVVPPLPDTSYGNFSTEEIKARTIDELVEKEKLPTPDIIKIDVEGAEYKVLLGATKTITDKQTTRGSVKPVLIIEIHTIPMMLYVSDFLKNAGYTIEIIDEKDNNIFTKIIYAEYKN